MKPAQEVAREMAEKLTKTWVEGDSFIQSIDKSIPIASFVEVCRAAKIFVKDYQKVIQVTCAETALHKSIDNLRTELERMGYKDVI